MKLVQVALTAVALVAPQVAPAQVGWHDQGGRSARLGAFAGARFRLPMGAVDREKPQLRLTLAGTRMIERSNGLRTSNVGGGLEVSMNRKTPMIALSDGELPVGTGRNMTTGGKVALIAGGLLLAGGIYFAVLLREAERNSQ